MNPIQVMLVDDQQLILEGIKTLLSIDSNIQVIADVKSSEEALLIMEDQKVDVILMDIRMPGMGGVEGTKKIHEMYPETKILILTTFDEDQYIIDALRFGACGYLLKDIEPQKLIESIYEAISGNLLLTGNVAKKLAHSAMDHATKEISKQKLFDHLDFSEREIEIIAFMLEGATSREISEKLYLTQGTVKNYFSSIYSKIGTNDRTKAILILHEFMKKDI